jgi:hypothetical protein
MSVMNVKRNAPLLSLLIPALFALVLAVQAAAAQALPPQGDGSVLRQPTGITASERVGDPRLGNGFDLQAARTTHTITGDPRGQRVRPATADCDLAERRHRCCLCGRSIDDLVRWQEGVQAFGDHQPGAGDHVVDRRRLDRGRARRRTGGDGAAPSPAAARRARLGHLLRAARGRSGVHRGLTAHARDGAGGAAAPTGGAAPDSLPGNLRRHERAGAEAFTNGCLTTG